MAITEKPERTMTAFRCEQAELDEIRRLASERGLNVTQYLLAAALQKLPEYATGAEQRIAELEQRIALLEERVDLAFE